MCYLHLFSYRNVIRHLIGLYNTSGRYVDVSVPRIQIDRIGIIFGRRDLYSDVKGIIIVICPQIRCCVIIPGLVRVISCLNI